MHNKKKFLFAFLFLSLVGFLSVQLRNIFFAEPSVATQDFASSAADELSLSFGGDVGLASSGLNSTATAGNDGIDLTPLPDLTSGVRPLWNADLNFANLETVVTTQELIPFQGKKYVFRTQPPAVNYLVSQGLNLFSTANNHAYDFSVAGVMETFMNMEEICKSDRCHSAGVGRTLDESLGVQVFNIKGRKVAFAAIGLLSENNPEHRAGLYKPGTASYRNLNSNTRAGGDYAALLRKLKETPAQLKILSIHFGTEGQIELDNGQREDYLQALDAGDVDIVLGHHAHVVRPWEVVVRQGRPRVIFYGLGNYMHLGTADITHQADKRKDYGLYGKVYFSYDPNTQHFRAQALQLSALTNTHFNASPLGGSENLLRLNLLNDLNRSSFGASTPVVETSSRWPYGRLCWGVNKGPQATALCK